MSFFLKTIFFGRKTENPLFSTFFTFFRFFGFRAISSKIRNYGHNPWSRTGLRTDFSSEKLFQSTFFVFSMGFIENLLRKFHFLMPEPTFANIG